MNAQETINTLTADDRALLDALFEDACNWSGTPLLEITPQQRGNLTHLKKLGILQTCTEDGCTFAVFTRLGEEMYTEFTGYDWDF